MNVWVGGWGGIPTPSTVFPAQMEVDHVRISRLREWPTQAALQIANPKPTYSSSGVIAVELADFDVGARVEVSDGGLLVETLASAPFRFRTAALPRGAHRLTFVGTDGTRTASGELAMTIQ